MEWTAKQLQVRMIDSSSAIAFIKKYHYSGSVCVNSQLHFGVFLPDGLLHGVMQFGPSLDKSKIQGLVAGTGFNEFLELNRMAFDDVLPRNSESRAIAVALRMIKKHAPQIKWVISYADATRCGDGTIYRASGFVLTLIKKNSAIYELPEAKAPVHLRSLTNHGGNRIVHEMTVKIGKSKGDFFSATKGKASVKDYMEKLGGKQLEGFQIRYIYFLQPEYRAKLQVPELPYAAIEQAGAGTYKGEKIKRAGVAQGQSGSDNLRADGGSTPTLPLQNKEG